MAEPAAHLREFPLEGRDGGYVGPSGVRKPTRIDRAGRSLTDVIVELGDEETERAGR